MEVNGHLPASIDAHVLRNELVNLEGWNRELVIPEGVETIHDTAIRRIGFSALRKRVIFPGTIRELTWKQLRDVGNADVVLPFRYFERIQDTDESSLPKGWESEPISLGRIVRAYLERKADTAAFAQSLLQPDAMAAAAERMIQMVEEKPRLTDRAVVFFVRNAQHIPRETAASLAEAAPGRFRSRTAADDPADAGDAVYDPVLLDDILRMAGLNPLDPAFDIATDAATGEHAHPYCVKSAIVPYIAEGLGVEVPSQQVQHRRWVRYVRAADAAAQQITGLDKVMAALMPVPPEMDTAQQAALLVPCGRYGGSLGAEYLLNVRGGSGCDRTLMLVEAGLVLNDSRAAFERMRQLEWDGRDAMERYVGLRYTNPLHKMLPDGILAQDRETLRAVLESAGEHHELSIGPGLKFRWRMDGEKRWLSGEKLMDARRVLSDQKKEPFFRIGSSLYLFVEALERYISRHLQHDYLSGRTRAADEVVHLCTDPLLRLGVQGVIWEQDGATFISQNGVLRMSDGSRYTPGSQPVRLAHVMDLPKAEVNAWRAYLDSTDTDSWMGQMDELNYRDVEICPDRYKGFELKPTYTKRKASLPVISVGAYNEVRVYADSVVLNFSDDYRRPSKYPKIQSVRLLAMDRRANRILHQMDTWSLEYRIQKNDETIVPLLERTSVKHLKRLLKAAQDGQLPEMTARLLRLLEQKTTKRDKSRFSLRKC